MQVLQLLAALPSYQLHQAPQGWENFQIHALTSDSRQVDAQTLFVAIQGSTHDGHQYLAPAAQQGALVLVAQRFDQALPEHCLAVQVADTSEALGLLAAAFHGFPARELQVVGVTGTNGKTTIATLLFRLFQSLGYTCGLISTVENRIDQTIVPATHTTPHAPQLQALLAQMRQAGCTHVFMEVSSHAAHQRRIAGLPFKGAIFSNLSHDHLDYHGTFDNYIKAKKLFFDHLPASAFALTNIDDKRGRVMVQNTKAKIYTLALRSPADFKAKILENHLQGLVLDIQGQVVHTRLVGDFNAYNLLSVYAAACLLGVESEQALQGISALQAAEGRFDCVYSQDQSVMGIVDYAHTPDALEKVLRTLDLINQDKSHLITVVGCGGDRDRSKRPVMAKVACTYSHRVILTSDNPRSEDPQAILQEMEQGVSAEHRAKTLVIADRRQAIRTACQLAQAGDIILVAGKGHEKYQEIQGHKHPFDDKAELQQALAEILHRQA